MAQFESALFTIGVFKDIAWAERGIDALKQQGFTAERMTLAAKASPEAAALIERVFGVAPESLELPVVGAAMARGTLTGTLNGSGRDLARIGMAAAMRRAGFQPHDGLIFETLVGKGGVLVAVEDAPRAADALAVLQSYGGGNAAIGAWTNRV
jgi:alkylhydroperoxidase/carboxymuconolactone decarboxylase family protein YurZ